MDPQLAILVFREIVAQHDREGADEDVIREGIDFREKTIVPEPGILAYLARLLAAGLIEQRGGRWFVATGLADVLPRTRQGQLSIASHAFRRFARRQIEHFFRPSNEELKPTATPSSLVE